MTNSLGGRRLRLSAPWSWPDKGALSRKRRPPRGFRHGSSVMGHSIMPDLTQKILAAVSRKSYQALKPKALARKIGVPAELYADFRRALRDLLKQGRVVTGKNHTIRPAQTSGTVAGTFHKTSA